MKKQISTTLFILFLGTTLQAQITRGAQEGELYISTDWYMDNYDKFKNQTGISHRVPWKSGALSVIKWFF